MPTNLLTQKIRLNILKKVRFSREKSEFHKNSKTITSIAREDGSVITDSAKFLPTLTHCSTFLYALRGLHLHGSTPLHGFYRVWGGFCFVLFFIWWFLMKSRVFKRQYCISYFPLFIVTKYDEIILVGISVRVIYKSADSVRKF